MKRNIFNAVESANKDSIAIEALIQAEDQFLRNDYNESELNEALGKDNGFTQIAYKDDEGFWRVTGSDVKYSSYDKLINHYPDLC